jgi:hypothetical protein
VLLKPGGYLVIAEPTFAPSAPLGALFWAKSLTARLTSRRLPIGGYWNNIGPPVVSYHSPDQLRTLVARLPPAECTRRLRRHKPQTFPSRSLATLNATGPANLGGVCA